MQTKEQSSNFNWRKILSAIAAVGAILILLYALSGCGLLKQKPIHIVERDSIYINNTDTTYLRDSIYLKDSVMVITKNDTVFITKTVYEYKDKYKYKAVHDTLWQDRIRDTTIYITEYVEKTLTKSQKFTMGLGKISIGIIIGILLYLCVKLYMKFF